MEKQQDEKKVITGKVRLSYAHIFEPYAIGAGAAKFSVCLLIPKSDKLTLGKIQRAVEAAKKEGVQKKWGGKLPVNLKLPLRDGDQEKPEQAEYRGHYFVNANSDTKPGLRDRYMNPIESPDEMYSGCFARASVTFFPFDMNGNKGVACGLNNLQKLADGPNLSGKPSADEDFEVYEDEYDYQEVEEEFLK